jgi:hypothetical protein
MEQAVESERSHPDLMTVDYFLLLMPVAEVFNMEKHNHMNEESMHEMQYAVLTEVLGRWKADIIESFLIAQEIDVVLIQGTVSDLFTTSFSPVKIFVPKASLQRARNLLKNFEDAQDNTGGPEHGE